MSADTSRQCEASLTTPGSLPQGPASVSHDDVRDSQPLRLLDLPQEVLIQIIHAVKALESDFDDEEAEEAPTLKPLDLDYCGRLPDIAVQWLQDRVELWYSSITEGMFPEFRTWVDRQDRTPSRSGSFPLSLHTLPYPLQLQLSHVVLWGLDCDLSTHDDPIAVFPLLPRVQERLWFALTDKCCSPKVLSDLNTLLDKPDMGDGENNTTDGPALADHSALIESLTRRLPLEHLARFSYAQILGSAIARGLSNDPSLWQQEMQLALEDLLTSRERLPWHTEAVDSWSTEPTTLDRSEGLQQGPSFGTSETAGEGEEMADTIESLYMTNKLLHELVKPLYWERVDFEGEPDHCLKSFDQLCLTKYAHLIKELYFRQMVDEEEREFYSEEEYEMEAFQASYRTEFLIRCLARISDLRHVDIDVRGDFRPDQRKWYYNRLRERLARHTNLEELTLSGTSSKGVEQAWVASVLMHVPKLRTLTLSYLCVSNSSDELPKAVATLQHLHYLDISNSVLTRHWFDVKLVSQLKALSLFELGFDGFPLAMFEVFIERNGEHLEYLDIETQFVRINEEETSMEATDEAGLSEFRPLLLPHLNHLRLYEIGDHTAVFDRFLNCPVRRLDIEGLAPQLDDCVALIQSRKLPHLSDLHLARNFPEDDYMDLIFACQRSNIRLSLIDDPDSSDNDDDEDEDDILDDDSWVDEDDMETYDSDSWETDEESVDQDSMDRD